MQLAAPVDRALALGAMPHAVAQARRRARGAMLKMNSYYFTDTRNKSTEQGSCMHISKG